MAVPESSQLAAEPAWRASARPALGPHPALAPLPDGGSRAPTRHHPWWWVLGTVVVLLIALRLIAPWLVTAVLNRKLAALPDYTGHVARVSLSLYRGAYQLHDVRFDSRPGIAPALDITCRELEIAMLWPRLLHGALAGSVVIIEPNVTVTVRPTAASGLAVAPPTTQPPQPPQPQAQPAPARTPAGAPVPKRSWQQIVGSFFPIDIAQIQLARGRMVYRDPGKAIDLGLGDVSLAVTNITNRAASSPSHTRIASFTAQGTTIGGGALRFGGDLDPFASVPQFAVQLALVHIDLTALDGLFIRYEKINIKKGSASIYVELHCSHGRLTGYLKPLLTDVSIFRLADVKKHGISAVKEAVVGTIAETFKNHPHDRFAGEVPLMGDITRPSTSIWKTIVSVVRNAFIKALQPGFDPQHEPPGELPPAQAAQPAQPALHAAQIAPAPH